MEIPFQEAHRPPAEQQPEESQPRPRVSFRVQAQVFPGNRCGSLRGDGLGDGAPGDRVARNGQNDRSCRALADVDPAQQTLHAGRDDDIPDRAHRIDPNTVTATERDRLRQVGAEKHPFFKARQGPPGEVGRASSVFERRQKGLKLGGQGRPLLRPLAWQSARRVRDGTVEGRGDRIRIELGRPLDRSLVQQPQAIPGAGQVSARHRGDVLVNHLGQALVWKAVRPLRIRVGHPRVPAMAALEDQDFVGQQARRVGPAHRARSHSNECQDRVHRGEAGSGPGHALPKIPVDIRPEPGIKEADQLDQVTPHEHGVDRPGTFDCGIREQLVGQVGQAGGALMSVLGDVCHAADNTVEAMVSGERP